MCGPKALEELRASGQSYYRRIESKVCSKFGWDSLHQWKQEKEIKRRWIVGRGRDIGWMSLSSSSSHWTNPLPGWRVAFGLPERTPAERYCPQDVVMWQPSWYGNITCHNPGHLRSINPWPRNLILAHNMSQQFGCRCRLNNGRCDPDSFEWTCPGGMWPACAREPQMDLCLQRQGEGLLEKFGQSLDINAMLIKRESSGECGAKKYSEVWFEEVCHGQFKHLYLFQHTHSALDSTQFVSHHEIRGFASHVRRILRCC